MSDDDYEKVEGGDVRLPQPRRSLHQWKWRRQAT